MATFCPIIKDNCKKSDCLAWKNEKCLIFVFLDLQVSNLEPEGEALSIIPDEIVSSTSEKLAEELFAFVIAKSTSDEEDDEMFESFWEQKKIDLSDVPESIERKIERIEEIARTENK